MPPQSARWKCPNCGRSFARKNQRHSCMSPAIEAHFQGKDPILRRTYETILTRIQKLDPFRVDAVKTSINFISKHHFGGIQVEKDCLRVGFLLERKLDDKRVVKTQPLGANRVGHTVKVSSPREVDAELIGWLKKAHSLQS